MIDMETATSSHLFLNFLVSMMVGLTMGMERTVNVREDWKMAGMRDFILVAALSYVSSLFYKEVPLAWIGAFGTVIMFTLAIFIIRNIRVTEKTVGMTTLLSIPFTFLVAALPNFGAPFWAVATILFVVLLVLGLKVRIYQFVHTIDRQEIIDFAVLIGIAISITPLIPPDARLPIPLFEYADGYITVIYRPVMVAALWKVVVMVSLMSFIAHFVTKYLKGKNALIIATFLGGLVSSLATIIMLLKNNEKPDETGKPAPALSIDQIFLGYVAAVTGAIFRIIIILRLALGYEVFEPFQFTLISLFVLFASLTAYSFIKLVDDKEMRNFRITQRPLPITFIFKFSGILAGLIIFMTMVTYYLGKDAFVLASFLSGIISSAGAVVSVASAMTQDASIGPWVAGVAIVGALLGSVFAKFVVIARKVQLKNAMRFLFPLAMMALVGFITLWITFSAII
ncbi:MAG: DUF4010 domain-containing protein [Alphaproteobacteria bacterium]|nr:DUF4010 domain-containing protein [Alphaproteobacteria bacterium]